MSDRCPSPARMLARRTAGSRAMRPTLAVVVAVAALMAFAVAPSIAGATIPYVSLGDSYEAPAKVLAKLDNNNQHKVHLDLGLELIFEDQTGVQPNKSAVEADIGEHGNPVPIGYRLVGVNVLQESYRAEVAPLVRSTGWASVTPLAFEDFFERYEICSHQ